MILLFLSLMIFWKVVIFHSGNAHAMPSLPSQIGVLASRIMSLSCYRRFLIPFFAILFCISSPQTYGLEASDYEKYRKAAEQGFEMQPIIGPFFA